MPRAPTSSPTASATTTRPGTHHHRPPTTATGGTPAARPIGPDGHGTLVAGVVAQIVPQATIEPVNVFAPVHVTSTQAQGGTTNATSSSQFVWKGLDYVAKHPFVNDPIRPNKTDRVVAAAFGFGTTTTFPSEGAAFHQFPQIVLSFKSKMQQLLKLGITPIAAAGQFGAPLNAGGTTTGTTTGGGSGGTNNNSNNTSIGDNNGMSLPAVLNEVVSVTGTYPFPFSEGPDTPPTDPTVGTVPRPLGPILIYSSSDDRRHRRHHHDHHRQQPVRADRGRLRLYSDRILASANRGWTTDYAAPAIDIPTFRRTFTQSSVPTTGTGTSTQTTDARDHNTFTEGGTSLSSGIVAGAFALVSSASITGRS